MLMLSIYDPVSYIFVQPIKSIALALYAMCTDLSLQWLNIYFFLFRKIYLKKKKNTWLVCIKIRQHPNFSFIVNLFKPNHQWDHFCCKQSSTNRCSDYKVKFKYLFTQYEYIIIEGSIKTFSSLWWMNSRSSNE